MAKEQSSATTKVQPTPDAIAAAREILLHKNPIQSHVDYAIDVRKVHGGKGSKGDHNVGLFCLSAGR